MRERDTRIMRLAARQFGAFAGEQAVRVGYPRSTIRARARSGVWERLHRDTYRVAGAEVPWQQSVASAWLSVGEPAAISGRAAASLWGLGVDLPGRPELLVPFARRVERPGVRIKRTRRWTEQDVVRLGSLGVTAVPRTLLDLARGPDELVLETALDVARRGHSQARGLTGGRSVRGLSAGRSGAPRASGSSPRCATRTVRSRASSRRSSSTC